MKKRVFAFIMATMVVFMASCSSGLSEKQTMLVMKETELKNYTQQYNENRKQRNELSLYQNNTMPQNAQRPAGNSYIDGADARAAISKLDAEAAKIEAKIKKVKEEISNLK